MNEINYDDCKSWSQGEPSDYISLSEIITSEAKKMNKFCCEYVYLCFFTVWIRIKYNF